MRNETSGIEFTYLNSDYYDYELACLEFAMRNIEKLDEFIVARINNSNN